VEQLEEKHFIETEHTNVFTKSGMKRNGNLKYTLRPIQEAIEYYYQMQLKVLIHEQAKAEANQRLDEYNRKRGRRAG